MERTITRIKNLKAKRKLSLPASPNPNIRQNAAQNGGVNSGLNPARRDSLSVSSGGGGGSGGDLLALPYSRIRSKSPLAEFYDGDTAEDDPHPSPYTTVMRRASHQESRIPGSGGSSPYRKVQWSPDVRSRKSSTPAAACFDFDPNQVRQHHQQQQQQVPPPSAGSRRSSSSARYTLPSAAAAVAGSSGRYRRSESVSTVEAESLRLRNHTRHGSLPHVFRNLVYGHHHHPGQPPPHPAAAPHPPQIHPYQNSNGGNSLTVSGMIR